MFPSGSGTPYRSARSVQPPPQATRKRGADKSSKRGCLVIAIVLLVLVTLTPVLFFETYMLETGTLPDLQKYEDSLHDKSIGGGGGISLNNLVHFSKDLLEERSHHANAYKLARGVSGLPIDHTPALVGAERGHLECDVVVNQMKFVYWNDPQGERDRNFVSPFKQASSDEESFMTFEPDAGGWNNIRMSLEIIIVLAAATGRTLVLPPKTPLYLMGDNKHSFDQFFDLFSTKLKKHVKIITMGEFLQKHASSLIPTYEKNKDMYTRLGGHCVHQPADSPNNCNNLYSVLRENGEQPSIDTTKSCFVFDKDMLNGEDISDDVHLKIDRFCGTDRVPFFYNSQLQSEKWIHWNAASKKNNHRLLTYFHTFLYFTDPVVDNFYKRFVRDFLHYKDDIYCAAAKVVKALTDEAKKKKISWSSLHIRRNDLSFEKVLISADEWYNNTKELWKPNEVLYFATDEKNKEFFEPFKQKHGHTIRFLHDYAKEAGLDTLEPAYLGIIDAIVASHGRAFVGTWFSTYSAYINRMRGYNGMSMKDSWYGWLPRKDIMREWTYPEGNYFAREWPIGWVGIDGDEIQEHESKLETPIVKREKFTITKEDLVPDEGFKALPVARGVAGRPLSETPALEGAHRGGIQCDINVDSMAYWNDLEGGKDETFISPFASEDKAEKYITFSSDRGGWNNIRMEFEIVYVLAAALGRTLVLPPKEIHYLLHDDEKNKYRGVTDFLSIMTPKAQKRVKVITFKEFIEIEGGPSGRLPIPEHLIEGVLGASEICDDEKHSFNPCLPVVQYLKEVGHLPNVRSRDACVVFDHDFFHDIEISDALEEKVLDITGFRKQAYFDQVSQEPTLIHFRGKEREYRLRAHFYGFVVFTDSRLDNYFKRLVRDVLHYNDEIFCAAGKIVKALQAEGRQRGFEPDKTGAGGYGAMHVRTGKDFGHKKVQFSANEWYENTFEIWKPNEILYISTDQKNQTFFNDLAVHHDIRFLEDYWEIAGLGKIDPNYMSMIDAIVAARSRAFAGTWFSTFSGYIVRMRGYYGMPMENTWYSWLDRKDAMHKWQTPTIFQYGNEWPDAWIGIDADVAPEKDIF